MEKEKISGPISCYLVHLEDGRKICIFGDSHNGFKGSCEEGLIYEQLSYIFEKCKNIEFKLMLEFSIPKSEKYRIVPYLSSYPLGTVISEYINCFKNPNEYCPKNVKIVNIDYRIYDPETIFNFNKYVSQHNMIRNFDENIMYERLIIFNQYLTRQIDSISFLEQFFNTSNTIRVKDVKTQPDALGIIYNEMIKLFESDINKYENIIEFIGDKLDSILNIKSEKMELLNDIIEKSLMFFFNGFTYELESFLNNKWGHFQLFINIFMDLHTLLMFENNNDNNSIVYAGENHSILYYQYFKKYYNLVYSREISPVNENVSRCLPIRVKDIIAFFQ